MLKKLIVFLLCAISACGMVGCGKTADVKIDYGTSSLYSKEEMNDAIKVIKKEFSTWNGCELHSISYLSDDQCTPETIAWMNELKAAKKLKEPLTQCIAFESDFHSPKNGGGAWNADEEYTHWQWWLARSEGGEWQLMTWGY